MHRVKKVAFRTRLQSVMSPRVYNHHFFTRNNSCLDLKRQCRTKVDERESGMSPTVLPQFPSTGPTLMSCPCWYTRSAFPVPTASFCPFGTPEARFLYQHISYSIWYTRSTSPVPTHLLFHLVHQKHVSCTNGAPQYIRCITKASSRTFSVLWNNRRPVLPGMKSYAHLKQHSLDN